MSKSSELDKTVKLYILGSIDGTPYDIKTDTNQERIDFLRDTFFSEQGFNIMRFGQLKAMQDWLSGLPSSISIAFSNYDILDLAVQWGAIPAHASERQQDKIIDNYFNFMANKVLQLLNGYRVPKIEVRTLEGAE